MKAQAYLDMTKRQQQELTDFPIAYAFNEKQLEEALEKLGATKEECCTYLNMGDVMKKTDVPAFKAMLRRHTEELQNAMKNEQFAEGEPKFVGPDMAAILGVRDILYPNLEDCGHPDYLGKRCIAGTDQSPLRMI